MSDSYRGFVVTLDRDIRDEEADPIAKAIRQLKHVVSCRPVVSDIESLMSEERVRRELMRKLMEVLS